LRIFIVKIFWFWAVKFDFLKNAFHSTVCWF
jgi:hypothetical protein